MLTIREYIEEANNVSSAEDLAALLVRDMASEGYDNVSFRRVKAGELLLVQCVSLPTSFIEEYYANEFMADDPLVAAALASPGKFYWADLEAKQTLSSRQYDVLQAFRDLGVHSGISFPFHGLDGSCDLIGLSQRQFDPVDPERLAIVEEKLRYTRWCYWELRQKHASLARLKRECDSWLDHKRGPPGMMAHHCRALVFVSVAAQRWECGFRRFNKHLLNYVAPEDLEYLLRWGLVHEVPDDEHFYYYLVPTVLGLNHFHNCSHVHEFRRQVWEMEVGGRGVVAG